MKKSATPQSRSQDVTHLEDDDDFNSFETKLVEAKLLRKKAEEDAQLLANRIALLQAEERKAMKKIDETKMKAKEIRDIKVRNLMQIREKELAQQQREEEERRRYMQNKFANEQKKINQEKRKAELQKKLKNDVNGLKREKKEISSKLYAKREEEFHKNYDMVQKIRYSQKEFKEKQKQKMQETKAKARKDYENRVYGELLLKESTDDLISQLERREMELIQRLQKTQSLQKSAFDDLERALSVTLH